MSVRTAERIDRLAAQVRELQGGAAVPGFADWLREVSPSWHWGWKHLAHVRRRLEAVTVGEARRLMIFMPPRHGKSEQVTVRYPVWRLERDPATRVIIAAYAQSLAERFSRRARRIADERIALSRERATAGDWETTVGGGVRAVGVGGGITGHGGDLVVIDDPLKSREEAESELVRDKVFEWYKDDLRTRLEPGGAIVLIQTRWHEDDLAGRLLAEAEQGGEQWEVVSLPALAEEDDPLGRKPGTALCPERFPVADLERIRDVLGSYSFSALYQQSPSPREGGFFKTSMIEIVDVAPTSARRVRYWDKAATIDGDFTVGVLMARAQPGAFYVEDVVRGQWTPAERDRVMARTASVDRENHGAAVAIWCEQEPGSSGLESAQATVRLLTGHPVRYERSTGSKEVRADPFAAQVEAGNVRMARATWNRAYLDELRSFPAGKHDDQVDASSGAFHKLAAARTLRFN